MLLVEDEPHKKEELTASLQGFFAGGAELEHVDSVSAAYSAVSERDYDLIILDMALPTFTAEGDAAGRGYDQAQGGVEVLRALKSRNLRAKIIIITQYPDITFGGKRLKLTEAPKVLSRRYNQDVVGSVLYKYRSPSNHTKLTALLKKFL
uniref:response regulator n=1 Tax=Porphyrobacter sp. GA68 TaxID=2883480 RepID=UPI001D188275|nr:response regulator [Porphyrobacter sp. GA68]